jgi:DNA-binding transcriptional MerR regulator
VQKQEALVKISELVKRTNVSKETIHYYIREGALPKPRKSGRNIADYDESMVEQIGLIKDLQENFFLPLSEIKKIIKQRKKHSLADKVKFGFLTKYVRPVDQIFFSTVTGRDNFLKETGLSEKWLSKMEQWGIITPETQNGTMIYSSDNVTIGKLIVDMGRLGFGPRDGYDPENLKLYADFVKNVILPTHMNFLREHTDLLMSPDFREKGIRLVEALGLFFYHIYRKTVKEEILRVVNEEEKKNTKSKPPGR